jgi:hypothetical protein
MSNQPPSTLRVALWNPPFKDRLSRDYSCPHTYKSHYAWPCTDLVAISGIFADAELMYLDSIMEGRSAPDPLSVLAAFKPDVVFMMTSSISEAEDLDWLRRLKEAHPCRVAILGDIATFDAARMARLPLVDGIVQDFAHRDALIRWAEGPTNERVIPFSGPGLFSIGVPRHDLFLKHAYYFPFSLHAHVAPVLTSYGCPFGCKFCNSGNMGFKVRRSEEIRDELVRIKQWGYREVFFRDFTFLPRKNIEVLQFMIDQRLNLSFGCTTRVDTVDEPSLRLMKKAGCYLVFYGAETGVEETLLRMNKGLPLQLLQEITRTTKRIGLETLMSFIIGFPHETGEHIRQTRVRDGRNPAPAGHGPGQFSKPGID